MQNKPKVKNAQINVSSFITSKYVKVDNWCNQKNKPKTNPILSAVGGLQMNLNPYTTIDYENFILLAGQKNKPNSNPIKPNLKRAQMNVNLTLTKDYRKKDDFLVRINKPNSRKTQNQRKLFYNKYICESGQLVKSEKQTQNKPNLVRRRRIAERPKSLAGKSGHTPYLPCGFFCCELSPKKAKIYRGYEKSIWGTVEPVRYQKLEKRTKQCHCRLNF